MKLLLLLAATFSMVLGECPQMKDIPVMYNDDYFMCAKYWQFWGADYSIDACNGNSYTIRDNQDTDAGDGRFYPMGSIMVKPGCTLYMYYDYNYSGEMKIVEGALYNNNWGHSDATDPAHYARGPESYKCRCIQKPVNCQPEDKYEVVLLCNNLYGNTTTTCTYSQTIGTEFSDSMTDGMSIDETIEYEMEAQFWEIFSERMGISVTTGYDWSHTTESTKSEQVTIEVSADAPPGWILIIEQAIGHCDGSEARTEMFKTSHQDSKGNIVFTKTEKLVNGKFVTF